MLKRSSYIGAQIRWAPLPILAVAIAGSGYLAGCGTSGVGGTMTTPEPPLIATEPTSQSVPMGLSATFAGVISGYPLSFQWYENGMPIAGATYPTYTTPPTAFSDTGSVFTVTASNSYGSVTTTPAVLTVTARAPQQGDLRFQQVDAASTTSGPTTGVTTDFFGWNGSSFTNSTGTPLSIGPGCPALGGPSVSCEWNLYAEDLPVGDTGLTVHYQGFPYSDFSSDLAQLGAQNQVVTSWDLEPLSSTFAASWVQSSSGEPFDIEVETVSASQLQAAASEDGINSRVITAISWLNGQISYLSYGWQGDKATTYDVKTETADITTILSVAQQLASEGYIITAMGGTVSNGLLLVGTKVHGDNMPRSMLVAQPPVSSPATLQSGGYAVVGWIQDIDPTTGTLLADYWIGER